MVGERDCRDCRVRLARLSGWHTLTPCVLCLAWRKGRTVPKFAIASVSCSSARNASVRLRLCGVVGCDLARIALREFLTVPSLSWFPSTKRFLGLCVRCRDGAGKSLILRFGMMAITRRVKRCGRSAASLIALWIAPCGKSVVRCIRRGRVAGFVTMKTDCRWCAMAGRMSARRTDRRECWLAGRLFALAVLRSVLLVFTAVRVSRKSKVR